MEKVRIETTPVTEIEMATSKLVNIQQKLPFQVSLTEAERLESRKLVRVNASALTELQVDVATARANQQSLPPSFDLAGLEEDAASVAALFKLKAQVEQLRRTVNDSLLALAKPTLAAATDGSSSGHHLFTRACS